MGSMDMDRTLPAYDDLTAGRSWGIWGEDDVFGCLNLLTPERVVRAAQCVRKGAVFALNLDVAQPDPPLYGRRRPEHVVHSGERSSDDELYFNTQASSQWDGFRHITGADGLYNGLGHDVHG